MTSFGIRQVGPYAEWDQFAALDIFEGDPVPDPRFLAFGNVLLKPDQASGTFETRNARGALVRDTLLAHFAGQPLLTPIV